MAIKKKKKNKEIRGKRRRGRNKESWSLENGKEQKILTALEYKRETERQGES